MSTPTKATRPFEQSPSRGARRGRDELLQIVSTRSVEVYGDVQPGVKDLLARHPLPPHGLLLDLGSSRRRIHLRAINVDIDRGESLDIFCDITKELPFADNTFDMVVCTAVLEHVSEPNFVVGEIYRVLRPGSLVWADIPFLQPYHPVPTDYQRYTLEGIRHLFRQFEEVECGNANAIGSAMAWLLNEFRQVILKHTTNLLLRDIFEKNWAQFETALCQMDEETPQVNADPSALNVTGAVFFCGRKRTETKKGESPLTIHREDYPQFLHRPEAESKLNKVCNVEDFSNPIFRKTLRRVMPGYPDYKVHRKAWEWTMGVYGIEMLAAPSRNSMFISVGGGIETPIYYFSNFVKLVFATDIYGSTDYKGAENPSRMLIAPEEFAGNPFYDRQRIVPRWADGRDLPFPDHMFDCVFSFSSIEHFGKSEDISRAAAEMGRILKPGGILCIATELSLKETVDPNHFNEIFTLETLRECIIEPCNCRLIEPIEDSVSEATWKTQIELSWAFEHPEHFPHIVLADGPNVWTSVILFMEKPL